MTGLMNLSSAIAGDAAPREVARALARAARAPRRRGPRSLDVIAACLGLLALLALVAALREGRVFAVPTVLAALMAVALAPVARALERRGVARALAAGGVVAGAVAALGALVYALAPSAEGFGQQLPGLAQSVEDALRRLRLDVGGLAAGAPGADGDGDAEDGLVASGREALVAGLLAAPALAGAILYCVFLSYFLLAERTRVARAALCLARSTPTRLAMLRAMRDVRLGVSHYLLTVTLINLGLGATAGVAFWLLGLPNAPIWGLAFGLMNFMPYIGPALVAFGVFAAGFVAHGGIEAALPPVIVLVALNALEGSVVTPALVSRRVEVSALAVFVAIAFGAWLWGAAGAVIATPALIFLRAFGLRLAEVYAPRRRRLAPRP